MASLGARTSKLEEELSKLRAKKGMKSLVKNEWKVASGILIPKPVRSPEAENLRPISLTSCLGEVVEHVINDRFSKHIDDEDLFQNNLIGFRAHISAQDAMLLIKHDIINRDIRDTRAILGLDLKKAFY
ncbi:uncharacterized protein LOC142765842 [Rhipicephalus microplus]|uniref:uncharacterized protein LOC142765842 n=1 Tax=Rhipicephalus microplus TaxID=6941 RepID=UPI003F6B26ED